MKKIIAICVLGLLFGCQSTIQDLNTKYLKSNNQTQAKKTVEKPKSLKHKLFINVTPSDANIYITNIKPKFKQGIELPNGDYKIKVKKQGYETVLNTINFNSESANKTLNITLKADALAFKSNKPIKRLTKLDRYGHDYDYSRVWGKGSPSLALAMLMEANNGEVSYPYKTWGGQSGVLNIETDLLKNVYSKIKKDLSYKDNIRYLDSKTKLAFNKVSAKSKYAKKNLESHYIIHVRRRISEEEYVKLYDDEDKTLTIKTSEFKATFFTEESRSYVGRSTYVDYANLSEISKKLKLNTGWGVYTASITPRFILDGYMYDNSFKFTNVSYDEFISGWSRMKKDKWCKGSEKVMDLEVLVSISNAKYSTNHNGYNGINLELKPLQARFQPIRKKMKI